MITVEILNLDKLEQHKRHDVVRLMTQNNNCQVVRVMKCLQKLHVSIEYPCFELLMKCPLVDLRLAALACRKHSKQAIQALVTQIQMLWQWQVVVLPPAQTIFAA